MNPNFAQRRQCWRDLIKNKKLLLILCLAFVIRIIFLLALQPWDQQVFQDRVLVADAIQYQRLALSLSSHRTLSLFDGLITPGYPFFLSSIYFLIGNKIFIVLVVQIVLNALFIFAVYVFAIEIFNRQVAIIASVLYAIDPHMILSSVKLLPDTLFSAVFFISVLFMVLGLNRKKSSYVYTSGALMGFAILLKPIAQYAPFVMIIMILCYKSSWLFRLKTIARFIVIIYAILFPWLYRNYSVYNHFKLTTIDGYNLLFYNAAYTEAMKTGMTLEEVRTQFGQKVLSSVADEENNPFEISKIYRRLGMQYINENRKFYIGMHVKGILNMFFNLGTKDICGHFGLKTKDLGFESFSSPNILETIRGFIRCKSLHEIVIGALIAIFLFLNYLFFAIGAISMMNRENIYNLIIIISILFYFSLLVGVVGLFRFKLPLIPFYQLAGAKGASNIFFFLANRRKKPNAEV